MFKGVDKLSGLSGLNEARTDVTYLTYLSQLTYLTEIGAVPILSDCTSRRRLSKVKHGPNPF